MMRERQTPPGDTAWGLGLELYAKTRDGGYIIGHDGADPPATIATARLDPATGDGIIILSTGIPFVARGIGGEWIYWKTGHSNRREQFFSGAWTHVFLILTGWVLLPCAAIFIFRRGSTV